MTNEEIDAEIARLIALKEQNNAQQARTNKPADGIYNPADYIGHTSIDGNDDENFMQRYSKYVSQLSATRPSNGDDRESSEAYRFVSDPKNAERYKKLSRSKYQTPGTQTPVTQTPGTQTPVTQTPVTQTPGTQTPGTQTPGTQTPVTQTPGTQDVSPKTKLDDARTAAYKRIKSKHASDADLAMFKDYTEEQLKNIGFGPISIAAIKGTNSKDNSSNGLSDDEQFMQQYKQYTQQLSGSQPRDPAALKAMQESDAHKFVTDQANKERYNKLTKAQEDTKKANKNAKKIEKLKQKLGGSVE